MQVRLQFIATALFLSVALSCSSGTPEPSADGGWVGAISTEGSVTTVINESGSVWGGTAELVEELSIGVAAGAPEYMFGEIAALYADDSGIWVVDEQTPAARLFDFDGAHIRDIGSRGEGPGEFTRPERIATGPDGRVFVVDAGTSRINVYSPDGAYLDEISLDRGVMWGGYIPLVIDPAGRPWVIYRDYDPFDPAARRDPRFVLRAHDSDGSTSEPMAIPEGPTTFPGAGRFRPGWVWNITPTGRMLSGGSDAYLFQISTTTETATIVEKYWEPVSVAAEEASYFEYLGTLAPNSRTPSPLPETKPAFLALLGAATGETWALRQGQGVKLPGCSDRPASVEEMVAAGQPCWLDSLFFDVFGEEGRFLGRVDVVEEMVDQILRWARTPHFAGDRVTAAAIDDAGTILVKRYRLVLPGEQEQ